jgi:hypothetical protein
MSEKHSPVHPALRVDFVTVPWKRRRRINFNAWTRVTAKTEPIPAVPSATVPPPLRSGPCGDSTGFPSRDGPPTMEVTRIGAIEEARRPRCN